MQKQCGNVIAFYGSDSIFSNHYLISFRVNGLTFICVEQYMMYRKAQYFKDTETAIKIMDSVNPAEMKRLGREVKNFNKDVWESVRYNVVKTAILAKFSQNKDLGMDLLLTKGKLLAEGSLHDCIWGVGMRVTDPCICNPTKWQGLNLQGEILMDVRDNHLIRNAEYAVV